MLMVVLPKVAGGLQEAEMQTSRCPFFRGGEKSLRSTAFCAMQVRALRSLGHEVLVLAGCPEAIKGNSTASAAEGSNIIEVRVQELRLSRS